MSNYLNLKDLAKELDDLRIRDANEHSLDDDEKDKLDELIAVEDELGDLHVYARDIDATLIPEEDFKEYAEELAEDIGAVGKNSSWIVIDWAASAENVKQDYTLVVYEGCEYYIRAN